MKTLASRAGSLGLRQTAGAFWQSKGLLTSWRRLPMIVIWLFLPLVLLATQAAAQVMPLISRVDISDIDFSPAFRAKLLESRAATRTRAYGFYRINPAATDQPTYTISYPGVEDLVVPYAFLKEKTYWRSNSLSSDTEVRFDVQGGKIESGSIRPRWGKSFIIFPTPRDGIYYMFESIGSEGMQQHPPGPPPIGVLSAEELRRKEEQQRLRRLREGAASSVGARKPTFGAPARLATALGTPVDIDVMVVVTPAAANELNSSRVSYTRAIRQDLQAANDSFTNSDIAVRLNLVDIYSFPIGTTASSSLDEVLLFARNHATVQALRMANAADIVVVVATHPTACGRTHQGPNDSELAFSVVSAGCMSDTAALTFAHEIGHIFGADHNFASFEQPPLTELGRAHGWPDQATHRYDAPYACSHTVMANPIQHYELGLGGRWLCQTKRLPQWSNPYKAVVLQPAPAYAYLGPVSIPMGWPGNLFGRQIVMDNASVVNANAATVASFRLEPPVPRSEATVPVMAAAAILLLSNTDPGRVTGPFPSDEPPQPPVPPADS
jgi:Metallo-peptidase family M12